MAATSREVSSLSGEGAWIPTEAGAHLRGRVTRNTTPEVRLRRAVHALGFRFRLNHRIGRYRPDFVLPRFRLAVFVDGCYWHNCPEHGPREFRGPNADRWRAKIAANERRDATANAVLVAAGWRVVRIWECETRADVLRAAASVAAVARRSDQAAGSVRAD